MRAEGGLEQRLAEPLVGIVKAHVDLAQDHLLLLGHLPLGQRRAERGVGQQVHGDRGVLRRHVDVVDGAVEGGVGVDVAAMRLDRGGDLPPRPALRALEQHVLEEMRQPRAEVAPLMDAAGLDPGLDGADRRGRVALEQDGQAVGQRVALGRIAPERLEERAVAGTEGGLGHGRDDEVQVRRRAGQPPCSGTAGARLTISCRRAGVHRRPRS